MALYVYKSNRTERLVDALAELSARPLARVFEPEWIVVSSPGMERWLSLELSKRFGVWANPRFPFPRKLIDGFLDALVPELSDAGAYDPACMLFGIARVLAEQVDSPLFAEARRYCGEGADGRRRFALAMRLADLFDQYLAYRPELSLEWAAGGGEGFQPALFRALAERHGPSHLAARAGEALRRLSRANDAPLPAALPERLHVFGVSSLPPLYLDLLSALGQRREVNLFLLSPTREYFGDLRPRRGARRPERRQLSFEDEGFRTEQHALLGSLGLHVREFQELLEERTQYVEAGDDLYEAPETNALLHVLQADLLALRTRAAEERVALDPADHSLAIHACHSAMREVEVLHDQLAYLISERGVAPHEIVVMTPNISNYASVIDAVFSQAPTQRPQIPFRIADRGVGHTRDLFLALEAVLDVLESRFGANQVLDLLGFDLIRERFEIAPDQLESLRTWIEDSGIRWGVDAAHRAELEQPACEENTWRFGLYRLALGYSTGGTPEQLFAGRAPAQLERGEGELLGRFLEFCHTLFNLRDSFRTPASVSAWRERMQELARGMFAERAGDAQLAADLQLLAAALRELEQHAERAGFCEALELASLRSVLGRALEVRAPAQGFLSGGVTFCQLLPMRCIPFKVLCLLGLHDGVFPASDNPLSFDLMQKARRLGDRSRRNDDRQLFLDALLCARERLIITYIGQSQRDGSPRPASVLVQELIETAAQSCELAGQDPALGPLARAAAMEQRLVTRHALSAANPRYFRAHDEPSWFSYAQASCRAARAAQQPARELAPFAVMRARVSELPTELSLRELERCLMRPAREFCQRRLGLYLGDDLNPLEEREPFKLDGLQRWQIGAEWLEQLAQGRAEHASLEAERARGRLPLHAPGKLLYERFGREVAAIRDRLTALVPGPPLPALELDLRLDGFHLVGRIDDLWPTLHVRAQYNKLNSRHELRHFIRHVALRCAAEERPNEPLPDRSVLIARDDSGIGLVTFALNGSAERCMRALLSLYRDALAQPLPLFAQASHAYAEQRVLKQKDHALALRSARGKWGDASSPKHTTDRDAYVEQLYPDFDAMLRVQPGQFEAAALRLYEPFWMSRR